MPLLRVIQNGGEREIPFEGSVLLSDLLANHGYFVPHPCGGRGVCKKCTVLLDGTSVLACRTYLSEDATAVLPDREVISSVTGGGETGRLTDRLCLCLDIGTTTLALALVSLDDGAIVRTVTAPNPQRAFGADVISRIDVCRRQGPAELQRVLLEQIRKMTGELLASFGLAGVNEMLVAGNTTMLHLFFGVDCSEMGVSPYTPVFLAEKEVDGESLGLPQVKTIRSLPGISAFVGADITAGMGYAGHPSSGRYRLLLDLGTNAEIALWSGDSILCTAAAAGPCFEGANISCGMTARPGAVCAVSGEGKCTVIGGGKAEGLCATGLIDAVAYGVKTEAIDETGFLEDDLLPVCDGVALTDKDIREFQLAKSAIRAGIETLLHQQGIGPDQVEGFYIAGGFSAGINVANAVAVGLIPESLADKVIPVNNASLLGTVGHACRPGTLPDLKNARYSDLSADPLFSRLFMEYMIF